MDDERPGADPTGALSAGSAGGTPGAAPLPTASVGSPAPPASSGSPTSPDPRTSAAGEGAGPGGLDPEALAAAVGSSGGRWPVSLLSLGILLFLLAIAGWWTQDAVGTVVNVGEADIGETITFTSDGGSYRLLSSGPLRPAAESTYCDLTYADESTRREVGGQGLQASRLGVDRLLTFEPPPGRTTVRCTSRGSDVTGNGRFQVLDADGPMHLVLIGVIAGAFAFLGLGIAGIVRTFRRSSAVAAGVGGPSGTGGRGRSQGLPAMFDPGGVVDLPEPDEGPDPD